MYEESVVTPIKQLDEVYYVVPKELEDQFVDLDCDTPVHEYARLDIMLEIINGYKMIPHGRSDFETEHYRFEKSGLGKGILAKVIPLAKRD